MQFDNLSVIIVTYNEENNIQECISSAFKITKNVFVVDSASTDKTVEIVKGMQVPIVDHPYITYAKKRNWAQENNPHKTEWVLHIDADERVDEGMKNWFWNSFETMQKKADGFMFCRRPIFMGKFLKHGGIYPTYTARLFKAEHGFCEDKAYDQHFVVNGKVEVVKGVEIENDITPNLNKFIDTHNFFSNYEAKEIYLNNAKPSVKARLFGNPVERRRWFKSKIFEKMPMFSRAIFYFLFRYFIKLGFLDGKEGFIFHVLQGFWFRFLIDAKVFEMKKNEKK